MAAESKSSVTISVEGAEEQEGASEMKVQKLAFSPWIFTDASAKENLLKWNLDAILGLCKVSFSGPFPTAPTERQRWLLQLVNAPELQAALADCKPAGAAAPMAGTVQDISVQQLSTKVTSMSFFDRLLDEGIVSKTGYIQKCLDNVVDDCTISDLLRDVFINEDSEYEYVWGEEDKQEVIWQLMRSIVTGGAMCQYEDTWDAYCDAVRATYKDMVKVFKNSTTGAIEVASLAFRLEAPPGSGLFARDSPHNLCLVCVDPASHTATVWHSNFVAFW